MKSKLLFCSLSLCSALATSSVLAETTPLQQIQAQWAQCQYNTKEGDEKTFCFSKNIATNQRYLTSAPNDPELTVWLAINKASLAGARGGLGALSLAEEAKALLEQVIASAPSTLEGSAYTSLGSLYYKVPGWPIGFGDDDKAEQMLKHALQINPTGIDANYFYGDYLVEEGRTSEAKVYLTRALQAPARPNRALADQGRKQEIQATLGKIK
ncbi:tetratricopeptide repeat protein [Motilimonas sp. KMU-193]|uniref:tetratricopeptide repeat protein n=1 Tax=Motilimonas sp. KMU-193 TaxID=3388668 RepID=UPI00396B35AA